MAKGKRRLKKTVNYILGDLLTATFVLAAAENADLEKVEAIQQKIVDVYNDYISRLSHIEPRNSKAFFKQFRTGINKEIEGIAEAIAAC